MCTLPAPAAAPGFLARLAARFSGRESRPETSCFFGRVNTPYVQLSGAWASIMNGSAWATNSRDALLTIAYTSGIRLVLGHVRGVSNGMRVALFLNGRRLPDAIQRGEAVYEVHEQGPETKYLEVMISPEEPDKNAFLTYGGCTVFAKL